jgi:hypothetical protein
MTVLGYTADLSSAPFWRCMVMPAVKYVQSLRPPRSVVRDDDGHAIVEVERTEALEHEAPAIDPNNVNESEPVYEDGSTIKSVPQHINYAERGEELSAYSLYDYCRLVLIKPLSAHSAQAGQRQPRQSGAGNSGSTRRIRCMGLMYKRCAAKYAPWLFDHLHQECQNLMCGLHPFSNYNGLRYPLHSIQFC